MKKAQESKRTMYMNVSNYLTVNSSVYTTNVPLNAAVGTFGTLLTNLNALRLKQETDPSGYTIDKKVLREAMADVSLRVANAIQAYAIGSGNHALYEQAHYTESDFRQLPDSEALDAANLIHGLAVTNQGALAPYQVPATLITQFQTKIDSFQGVITAPRDAINVAKQATEDIVEVMKQIDNLLKTSLDKLIFAYKFTNLNFYNGYQNAREIQEVGATSQIKAGDIAIGATLNLDFRPFTEGHNIRLHNMGSSELEFYRSATPAGPGGGITVAPNHDMVTSVTNLGGGVFINVRNTGPVEGKYHVTLNF